jgi:secondary thiamine-phosphate synthase enzyme
MDALTFVPEAATAAATLELSTAHPTQFVDITDRLQSMVASAGISSGLLNVQTLHTTTAIVVNEHEPLLLADFAALLARAVPAGVPYQHDDMSVRTVNLTTVERPNGHAHCRALLLPSSTCLNILDGRLRLGRWQRVFFVEFDGPQRRQVSVMLLGMRS